MNKTKAQYLHNLVRYPTIAVVIPLKFASFLLKYISKGLILLSYKWGNFLINKIKYN